jgi:hypothetical protein
MEYQSMMNSDGEIELIISNDKNRFARILQDEILRRLDDIVNKREK